MKTHLFYSANNRLKTSILSGTNKILSLLEVALLVLMTHLNGTAQCTQSDILITTNTVWTNQTVDLVNNQKITVRGATLTIVNCLLRQKPLCTGNWDGIYLEKSNLGVKGGLIANSGTRIEFSKNGITALNGFSEITLDDVEMSDNGAIIRARDNWPFTSFTGFDSGEVESRGGGATSPYEVGCTELLTPAPQKVTIRNGCILKPVENGSSTTPVRYRTQINVLGAALDIINSQIINTSDLRMAAIAQSNGKCKIYGDSKIDGFWIGVYKGTDSHGLCSSEGLLIKGTCIINTDLYSTYAGAAILNYSPTAYIKGNIIEGPVRSEGACYGSLLNNRIYNGEDADLPTPAVFILRPKESFRMINNGLFNMNFDFLGNNIHTYGICNEWTDSDYAVIAGGDNQFPMSWGTISNSAGNTWTNVKSGIYNLSGVDQDFDYYYDDINAHEEFYWGDQVDEHTSNDGNDYCTYDYPDDCEDIDPYDEDVDIEALEEDYDDILMAIASLIGHYDTTVTSVKEELMNLRSQLSDVIGKCLLFHTSMDEFWTPEVDSKIVELYGLNHLWYGGDMFSITEYLDSNPDPDAEALYDAAEKMTAYFGNGKYLTTLTTLQVDTLETIAESSFGDYTNILRSFLFMVYGSYIQNPVEQPLDSILRRAPIENPITGPVMTAPKHTLSPNPVTDDLRIQSISSKFEGSESHVYVYDIEGTLVFSSIIDATSWRVNLTKLDPGIYIVKIENGATGETDVQRIYKN